MLNSAYLPSCVKYLCFIDWITLARKDFESDPIPATFQPGQSRQTICVVITDDDIKKRSERFRLILSIPNNVRALGVRTDFPYYADVVTTGIYIYST